MLFSWDFTIFASLQTIKQIHMQRAYIQMFSLDDKNLTCEFHVPFKK
jgi:hypothetical protein